MLKRIHRFSGRYTCHIARRWSSCSVGLLLRRLLLLLSWDFFPRGKIVHASFFDCQALRSRNRSPADHVKKQRRVRGTMGAAKWRHTRRKPPCGHYQSMVPNCSPDEAQRNPGTTQHLHLAYDFLPTDVTPQRLRHPDIALPVLAILHQRHQRAAHGKPRSI
jgi:hypothetical protein